MMTASKARSNRLGQAKTMVKDDVVLGRDVAIFQPDLVNLYGCEIGDETKIGAFVEIRKGVKIGARCKIQAFAFIPEGVTVEDGVFIGPHVCFTNDRYPAAVNTDGSLKRPEDWKTETTLVRAGASIGANATILCGITIGRHALVAAGAVVIRDVEDYMVVAGNPARVIGDVRKR
jgi:acetyltransferase-like isoleucine patch superfamily enzyme